jgi:probable FeS assembly SUF system protein SufT
VDVIVTDSRGNPVKNLTQADFSVFEDGKPQTVETFKLIDLAAAPERGGEVPRAIRSDSDEEFEAGRDDIRLVAIFLDDYHVRRSSGMAVREPLAGFVAKQLSPGDMVAVMYPLTPTAALRFTRDHDAVIEEVRRFEGRKYDYRPRNEIEERYAYYPAAVVERLRNQVTLTALTGLATRMGSLREGRKSIILVSEGFTNTLPAQLNDPVAAMPGVGNPSRGVPNMAQPSQREEWQRFVGELDIQRELRQVYDPEIPVNIVDLGLVYDLAIEALPAGGSRVTVKMTLTAPGCGMGDIIAEDARRRIATLPGVADADVQVVFDPPWNQSMMSEVAKLELGML